MRRLISLIALIIIAIGALVFLFRSSSDKELALPELGVTIEADDDLDDLTYETTTIQGVGTVLRMMASSIETGGKTCELGVMYKLDEASVEKGETFWTTDRLDALLVEQHGMPPQAKKLGDSYLVFEPSQSACAAVDDPDTLKLEGKKRKELWKSVSTAEVNG